MGFCQLSWIIEGRVFYVKWPEIIDHEGTIAFRADMTTYLSQATGAKVHAVSDTYLVKQLPKIQEIQQAMSVIKHDNLGWIVSLEPNHGLVKMMAQVISRIRPMHVRFVKDVDEAIRFLNEGDPTLPDLTPYRDQIEALTKLTETHRN
jgi:hypothetical protein